MKIEIKKLSYEKVMSLKRPGRRQPKKPNLFFRTLIRVLTVFGMAGTRFRYTSERMDLIGRDEPCLILMNHTCFLDMQIAYRILYPRHFCIACAADAFIGMGGFMGWLLHTIGCIPTRRYITDLALVRDMSYCFKELKTSVLMYPEACYCFDGTATTLPRKMGILLKKYDVPVVMIETFGAFGRNPLYNELQIRKSVPVSAKVRCLYTREEIREKSVQELTEGIEAAFGFDHFRWQQEQGLHIRENFRADGLQRILFQCPNCLAEGKMTGKGTTVKCGHCGKTWELTELGQMQAQEGDTEFSHIPDWYAWEREQIRSQILEGTYRLEADVEIIVLADYKSLYKVGRGHLTHTKEGFTLTGCDGSLRYTQPPQFSYSLNADYYWYELGDVICIGDNDTLYYCLGENWDVAKAKLAAEEMFKLYKAKQLK